MTMYKSSIDVAVNPLPHFQGWIVTLPELFQRKSMAGIPGPFRDLNFGDFVGMSKQIKFSNTTTNATGKNPPQKPSREPII
jgi:hypothetical protein